MNNIPLLERLANKALKHPDTDNDGLTVFDNDELKKFAELIVQECQTVVEWAISVDSTIDRVPVLIKEHFGVEE